MTKDVTKVVTRAVAKKAFALRLDDKMLSALQRWADAEFRSVNGQIEYLLHDALRKAGRLTAQNPEVAAAEQTQRPADKPDSKAT